MDGHPQGCLWATRHPAAATTLGEVQLARAQMKDHRPRQRPQAGLATDRHLCLPVRQPTKKPYAQCAMKKPKASGVRFFKHKRVDPRRVDDFDKYISLLDRPMRLRLVADLDIARPLDLPRTSMTSHP